MRSRQAQEAMKRIHSAQDLGSSKAAKAGEDYEPGRRDDTVDTDEASESEVSTEAHAIQHGAGSCIVKSLRRYRKVNISLGSVRQPSSPVGPLRIS